MNIQVEPLRDRTQTARRIYSMAFDFWPDLDKHGLLDKDLQSVFETVRKIPYKEDNGAFLAGGEKSDFYDDEVIGRPLHLLDPAKFPALDCKKKAVIIGSWLEAHGVPWRLVATSEAPDKHIHHIFPQAKIDKKWVNVDATYPDYELFESKPDTTAGEVFF